MMFSFTFSPSSFCTWQTFKGMLEKLQLTELYAMQTRVIYSLGSLSVLCCNLMVSVLIDSRATTSSYQSVFDYHCLRTSCPSQVTQHQCTCKADTCCTLTWPYPAVKSILLVFCCCDRAVSALPAASLSIAWAAFQPKTASGII